MTPIHQLKRGDCKRELQNQLNKNRKHPPGAQARPKQALHVTSSRCLVLVWPARPIPSLPFYNWGEPERDPHDEVYVFFFCLSVCLSVGTFTFRIYSCSNSTITHAQNLLPSMNLITPAIMLPMPSKMSCSGASPNMNAGAVITLLASSVWDSCISLCAVQPT